MTEASLNNPHDHYARRFLSDKSNARDLLENFLPADLKGHLRLKELKLDPTSYVDEKLKDAQTDVLFSVPLANKEPAYVYVLVEHKSYNEKRVTLQLLKYMLRIWEACKKQDPLPMIFPLVLYHGPEAWSASSRFSELFEIPEGLEPYAVDFQAKLVDLRTESDENLRGSGVYLAQLSLMKNFFNDDLPRILGEILAHLKDLGTLPELMAALEPMIRYLSVQKNLDDDNVKQTLHETFKQQGDDIVLTFLTKAEEKGELRGELIGESRSLVRVLNKRFGPGDYDSRIKGATLEQLDVWLDRALDAECVEDVFAP